MWGLSEFMLDAIVLSDIHLDSENCQGKRLVRLLERIGTPGWETRSVILNGDVFDNLDHRLPKNQWKILSLLRKLSDQTKIIWVLGNHDSPKEVIGYVAQLLGVSLYKEHVLVSGRERMLFVHGDQFDHFIDNHPILTRIGDTVYNWLQKLDQSHRVAKKAKRHTKAFLRCVEKVRQGAIERAERLGCTAVCCGHTHHAEAVTNGRIRYFNSGCWTELPGTYLTIQNGDVELRSWEDPPGEHEELLEAEVLLPESSGDALAQGMPVEFR